MNGVVIGPQIAKMDDVSDVVTKFIYLGAVAIAAVVIIGYYSKK